MTKFSTFQVDQEDSNNEVDSKKACLLSSMEAMFPSETLNGIPQNPPNERNYPVNGNGEHKDATVPVLQTYPARFYFNCNRAEMSNDESIVHCSFFAHLSALQREAICPRPVPRCR